MDGRTDGWMRVRKGREGEGPRVAREAAGAGGMDGWMDGRRARYERVGPGRERIWHSKL
jgi:hypothetical protein